jgi:hypothetical protein
MQETPRNPSPAAPPKPAESFFCHRFALQSFELTQPPAHFPQLSDANLRELAEARLALRKINRAVAVAKFDGWTMGIFGGLSFVMGLGGDWINILVGMALVVFAWVELRGASMLRKLETQATKMLGRNQLALGLMIGLYSGWQIWVQASGNGESSDFSEVDPTLLKSTEIGFYLLVILVAVVAMGAMSRYYFSRARYLDAYLKETPPWILEMQRAGISI